MASPRPQPGGGGYDPIAFFHGGGRGTGCEDLEDGFVAGDGDGVGRGEDREKGREGGVGALDLVYVCGIERGGERG